MTVLVVALMQMAVGIADTASTYDFAATSQWRRQDGIWSPNRQTEGQLPANQQNGTVTTGAQADKVTGLLGVTAEAVSSAPTSTSMGSIPLPMVELCSFAPHPSVQPTYDQQFGGFVCAQRGVKVGVAKASVKKTFFLGSTPVTYTVTVSVNTDYFEPTASGPTGIIFCQQFQLPSQVPQNVRDQVEPQVRTRCEQQLASAPTQFQDSFGTIGAKSEGSSFVQLNASALFENGSHTTNPQVQEDCFKGVWCDFRNTPHGSIEDYPVSKREKWLHPGMTNLVFQIRGTGALSIFVELQAQSTTRGLARAAASCNLDVVSITVTPNS